MFLTRVGWCCKKFSNLFFPPLHLVVLFSVVPIVYCKCSVRRASCGAARCLSTRQSVSPDTAGSQHITQPCLWLLIYNEWNINVTVILISFSVLELSDFIQVAVAMMMTSVTFSLGTDKLDGLAGGGKRKRDVSAMEDFLQLPDDYASRMSQPGKKRVNITQNIWINFCFTLRSFIILHL